MRQRSLQTSGLRAAFAAVLAAAACRPGADGSPSGRREVGAVLISLEHPGHVSHAFLTAGDRDTLRAQAYTGGWPSRVVYDSRGEPRRFTYTSTDPRVAVVNADGVVEARAVGTAELRAASSGVEGLPLTLAVMPAARALRAVPAALEAFVGDTVTLTISAVDERGADVPGVRFTIAPDTTVWAVLGAPVGGSGQLVTPHVLRFPAAAAGRVRLLAQSLNERPPARLQTPPVSVTVHAR